MTIFYGIMQWGLSVVEIFLCYCFCDVMMDMVVVRRKWIYVVSWSIVIGTLLDINRYLAFMSCNMLLFQCALIFLSLIRKCRSKSFYLGSVLAYNACLALMQLFNAFVLLVVVRVIEVDDIYTEITIFRILCYSMSLFIIYGMIAGISNYKKSNSVNLGSSKWIFFVYGIIGTFLVLAFQAQMLTYGKSKSVENTISLSLFITLTSLGFFIYIHDLATRAEYQLLERKNRMKEEHCQEIYQMYENCACTIHDFKHHLLLIEDYCRTGETGKALEYMEKIRKPFRNMEQYIKSGNEIVDLIFSFKIAEANEKGIIIENKIGNMCGISIEDNDLCSIFSNLIDNAIEACDAIKQGKKWIKILVSNQGDMLIVKIENTYGNELHGFQGDYRTDKKGVHGFGMKSVRLKVEKYGGDVKWSHTDGVFTAVITFFNVMTNPESSVK